MCVFNYLLLKNIYPYQGFAMVLVSLSVLNVSSFQRGVNCELYQDKLTGMDIYGSSKLMKFKFIFWKLKK